MVSLAHFPTLQKKNQPSEFFDILESLENPATLQLYSFLKLSNKFFDWIILRGEEQFINLCQLYTSTGNFRLSVQFLSFYWQYCTKNNENLPPIYKSTAKKTCQ